LPSCPTGQIGFPLLGGGFYIIAMEVTIKTTKKIKVKYLQVKAGVRYWEDATVTDVEDEQGDLIPCRVDDNWCPLIDLDTGQILNWKEGTKADIHYKVCDEGVYALLDESKNVVVEYEGYVPNSMSPKDSGFGDYIIMDVDEKGFIAKWEPDLTDFYED